MLAATSSTQPAARCPTCGRAASMTPADLRVYAAIGPPRCCGRPMAVPASPTATPGVERRAERRRPAHPAVRVCLRRADDPADDGPELAEGLVDVSAGGVGVLLSVAVMAGDRVRLTLRRSGAARAVERTGRARWCAAVGGGRYRVGIDLDRALAPAEVDALAR